MTRTLLVLLLLAGAAPGWADYRVAAVAQVLLGELEGAGQVFDPRLSPGGGHFSLELLGAEGDTLEVHWGPAAGPYPLHLTGLAPLLPRTEHDPFDLGGGGRPVSENLSWGPPKRGRPRLTAAATRKAVAQGASRVNFDLYFVEPGRQRFLTDHVENDAHPAFSPDGEMIAFTSGRTGQGDIYLYHFFSATVPLVRITYESAGSEIYPAWGPAGRRIVYTGHLAGQDHVYVVDDVRVLADAATAATLRSAARRLTRDLTPGWRGSCLAPSISPDGRWVAFYSRQGAGGPADLYIVPIEGGEPRLLLQGGLPETRGGPRWSPQSDGLFAVREDADRFNPLVWVPVVPGEGTTLLQTGTELNGDPFPVPGNDDAVVLLFTAHGSADRAQKRWRKVYAALLEREKGP